MDQLSPLLVGQIIYHLSFREKISLSWVCKHLSDTVMGDQLYQWHLELLKQSWKAVSCGRSTNRPKLLSKVAHLVDRGDFSYFPYDFDTVVTKFLISNKPLWQYHVDTNRIGKFLGQSLKEIAEIAIKEKDYVTLGILKDNIGYNIRKTDLHYYPSDKEELRKILIFFGETPSEKELDDIMKDHHNF
jgi:hypothetical protein